MNSPRFKSATKVTSEITELVRGADQRLLDRVTPMVRKHSVVLDLRKVERIDAAGLAALIRLYCAARDAGHTFGVSHPMPRVAEFLALVRLDGLLVPKHEEDMVCGACLNLHESVA